MRRRERNWMPEVLWFHLQRSKPQALEFSSPTRRSLPASTTLSHIPHPPAQRPGRPHHCAHGLRRSCSSVVTRIFCGLIWKKKKQGCERFFACSEGKWASPSQTDHTAGWLDCAGRWKAVRRQFTINLSSMFGEERENKGWCVCTNTATVLKRWELSTFIHSHVFTNMQTLQYRNSYFHCMKKINKLVLSKLT